MKFRRFDDGEDFGGLTKNRCGAGFGMVDSWLVFPLSR